MDVSAWLRDLGLEGYAQAFQAHDINAEVLQRLTADDLIALGISSVGHRRKLFEAIAALDQRMATAASETTAAAAPRLEAERRQLTVLFCDLVGSTELAARLDPEDLRDVMRAYQTACANVVRGFEGHLARFLGDGVLAYFGWPRAHEDDAERAVRAGLQLVRDVARLEPRARVRLQARVGVATGQVVVGDLISEGISDKGAVSGHTPNLAARLQAVATPASVVISQSTRRLVVGLFELVDLGPQRLKGFAEPLNAWQVEGVCRAEGRFEARHRANLTPLVGREEELALLLRRWQQARDGEGQVVLLSGEPGIGKSRLVWELRERIAAEPHLRLTHQCSPYHQASPLHPVLEYLERAAGFEHDDATEVKFSKLEELLARATDRLDEAVPLLAALLGLPTDHHYPSLEMTPQRQKHRTFEVLIDQLKQLSHDQPLVLVYEDVHWIDPSTLELLSMVIERIRELPVLALITFRPEFQPPWAGQPHVTSLVMSRLGAQQGADLVARVTGAKPLPAEVVEQIVKHTDGVPLFAEELTKAVLESALLVDAGDRYELAEPLPPLAVPATLHDSLMARLDRLGPTKEIAQLGAVIGREFSYALLAALADDRSGDQLRSALDQLVRSELVLRRGVSAKDVYTFKHTMVQDVAYQSLLKARRQQLHKRLVHALEKNEPEAERWRRTNHFVLLAYHCVEAGLIGQAVQYYCKAAALGVRRYAHMEVLTNARRGLELLERLPASSGRRAEALELQTAIAETLAAQKGYAAAPTIEAFRKLRELCDTPQDSVQLRNALRILTGFLFARHDWDGARQTAERILLIGARENDVVAEVMGRRELGLICFARGDNVAACVHLNEAALQHAAHRKSVDFSSCWDPHISSMSYLACALFALGYPDKAIKQCGQAVAEARKSRWDNAIGAALSCWCRLFQAMGDWKAVEDAADEMLSRLDEAESEWRTRAEVFRIWARAAAGRTDETRTRIQAFSGGSRERVDLPPYYSGLISQSYAAAGMVEDALGKISEAIERGLREGDREGEAEMHRLKGQWLLSLPQPKPSEAEGLFQHAVRVAQSQSAKLWELRATMSLARLRINQGDQQEARDLLASIYGWFTEGFETADLKGAKALLQEFR